MNDLPLVSIVIPTLKSEKTLERCLHSVLNQTYDNIEVIIVDAGSEDKTVSIAEEFRVKIINANVRNMAKQTNIGAKEASGKYIYRLDSDVILSNLLVEECVNKCEVEKCDAVSTYWGPDPSISFWAKVRKFEKDCYKYDKKHNVARFYRSVVFHKIGGYNENLVAGEDYDVQNRLESINFSTCFAKSEGIHLGEPKSISQIIKSNYKYGKTAHFFLKDHKYNGMKQMGPLKLSLLINWRKFLSKPVLTAGFCFYYCTVYFTAFIGIIAGIIDHR